MRDFKKRETIVCTSGTYSDYYINGLFIAVKDFNANDLLKKWADETGRKFEDEISTRFQKVKCRVPFDFENEKVNYLGWLSKNNYINDLNFRELHIDENEGLTIRGEYE